MLIEQDTQGCFSLKVPMKDQNIIIDGQHFFDQPIRNKIHTRTFKKLQLVKEMIKQLAVY